MGAFQKAWHGGAGSNRGGGKTKGKGKKKPTPSGAAVGRVSLPMRSCSLPTGASGRCASGPKRSVSALQPSGDDSDPNGEDDFD